MFNAKFNVDSFEFDFRQQKLEVERPVHFVYLFFRLFMKHYEIFNKETQVHVTENRMERKKLQRLFN